LTSKSTASPLSKTPAAALYLYIVESAEPVGRDDAARALGMSRALAAFHLDKLVEQGLLDTSFRRLTGRTGPGAGRPSKLYGRSSRQLAVSLPPRRYELAARLFARALDQNRSSAASSSLDGIAEEFGRDLGRRVRDQWNAGLPPLLSCADRLLKCAPFRSFSLVFLTPRFFSIVIRTSPSLVIPLRLPH
jgi:predicted ArsR family transcriptional regulator